MLFFPSDRIARASSPTPLPQDLDRTLLMKEHWSGKSRTTENKGGTLQVMGDPGLRRHRFSRCPLVEEQVSLRKTRTGSRTSRWADRLV